MGKTVEQIMLEHTEACLRGNIEEAVSHYCEDAFVVSQNGVFRGRDEIRKIMVNMAENVVTPGTKHEILHIYSEGNIGYGEWRAENDHIAVLYAVDTFVIRDGKIAVQTAGIVAKPK